MISAKSWKKVVGAKSCWPQKLLAPKVAGAKSCWPQKLLAPKVAEMVRSADKNTFFGGFLPVFCPVFCLITDNLYMRCLFCKKESSIWPTLAVGAPFTKFRHVWGHHLLCQHTNTKDIAGQSANTYPPRKFQISCNHITSDGRAKSTRVQRRHKKSENETIRASLFSEGGGYNSNGFTSAARVAYTYILILNMHTM